MGIHWRAMTTFDLPAVEAIAGIVHPGFPEDARVLAERQRLYPSGTQVLELGGIPSGYVLSHPWRMGELPALNSYLGRIPDNADTYYLHDLALLPAARGSGAAGVVVDGLIAHSRRAGFASMSLVAVNGSAPFWQKHGFAVVAPGDLTAKLASYEATACLMVRTDCVVTKM